MYIFLVWYKSTISKNVHVVTCANIYEILRKNKKMQLNLSNKERKSR